jgi:Serine incorporator (Serinc)
MNPTPTSADPNAINLDVPFLDPEVQPASGLVVEEYDRGEERTRDVWKLNAVMALICCWVTMTLTGWGTIEVLNENQNAANPTVGRVNMAMLGISQWVAIALYSWTLLAPKLFPDRDFS